MSSEIFMNLIWKKHKDPSEKIAQLKKINKSEVDTFWSETAEWHMREQEDNKHNKPVTKHMIVVDVIYLYLWDSWGANLWRR